MAGNSAKTLSRSGWISTQFCLTVLQTYSIVHYGLPRIPSNNMDNKAWSDGTDNAVSEHVMKSDLMKILFLARTLSIVFAVLLKGMCQIRCDAFAY